MLYLAAVLLGVSSRTTHFIWMQPLNCGAPCQALRPLWDHLPETFPQNTWESQRWKGPIAFGALQEGLEPIQYAGERSTEALLTWVEQHSQTAASQLHRNFELIYKLGLWKGEEAVSASGHGSEQDANVAFVQFLNGLIANYSLTSVVDVGSGDWSYMKQVSIPHYTGYDVSQLIVDQTTLQYAAQNVSFHLATAKQVYAAADLLICKDVLQHLPYQEVHRILEQRTNYRVAVFVNDVAPTENKDVRAGSYRSLDVQKKPFGIHCDLLLLLHPLAQGRGGLKTTCVLINEKEL
jgi:hypothetical protein